MITRFRVSNYKALRDVTLALSPVHVLIGPNDSGKTSIMEALAALCRSVDHQLQDAFTGPWQGLDLVWQRGETKTIGFEVDVELDATSFRYQLGCRPTPTGRGMQIVYENVVSLNRENDLTTTGSNGTRVWRTLTQGDAATDEIRMAAKLVHDGLSGVHFYRWTPDFLGLPAAADSSRRFRMEPSGFGLARFLDDILGFDPKRFLDLERRFTDIFPEFRAIRLVPEPAYRIPPNVEQIPLLQKSDGKGIHFELAGKGQTIPAAHASDGVLLVLAYLALSHLPAQFAPRVLLIEEPENGIHPRRLQDVLTILRQAVQEQKRTQILLTTHSPYVVDQFAPEEVTLCRKDTDGSVMVRRLSESTAVRKQLDIFTLGEIWTGEGDDALAESSPAEADSADLDLGAQRCPHGFAPLLERLRSL
jgi:predicted ATPase